MVSETVRKPIDAMTLVDGVRGGQVRAVSRLISLIERREATAVDALRSLQPALGRAHVVGITGPPGSGKSTLLDRLIEIPRAANLRVAIVAVDPTSPFSRGAILADRLRMQRHANDPGTFIRSLASRDELGGLSEITWDAVRVLDAAGYDIILVETVGAGQLETDIVAGAHTVVVVTIPGLGDSVQAIKAGIMEIAHIFVVNMADRDKTSMAVNHLQEMLSLGTHRDWEIPILTTVATQGQGLQELWEAICRHRASAKPDAIADRRRDKARAELLKGLERRWRQHLRETLEASGSLELRVEQVASEQLDTHTACDALWRELQESRE
jgi:LAO/AO transport system kinase